MIRVGRPWNSVSESVLWLLRTQGLSFINHDCFFPGYLFPSGFLAAGLIRLVLFLVTLSRLMGRTHGQSSSRQMQRHQKSAQQVSSGRNRQSGSTFIRTDRYCYSAEIHRKDSGLWRLHVVQPVLTHTLTHTLTHSHALTLTAIKITQR